MSDSFEKDRHFDISTAIPDFVYDNLPYPLKATCELIKNPGQKDVFLLGTLGMISGVLDGIYGIYGGDMVHPNLYIIVIAPSSWGKGILKKAKMLVSTIEDLHVEEKQSQKDAPEPENKKNKDDQYPKHLFLSGNSSFAAIMEFYQYNRRGIIFETEADAIFFAMKNDWGDYGYLLRCAYHHEEVRIHRKGKPKFQFIEYPILSVVISGTTDQFKSLISHIGDGLVSRLTIHYVEDYPEYESQFNKEYTDLHFLCYALDIEEKIQEIEKNSPIEFSLSETQQKNLDKKMNSWREKYTDLYGQDAISITNRIGLIVFRYCMILTALRSKYPDLKEKELLCSDLDFNIGINLAEVNLEHMFRYLEKSILNNAIMLSKAEKMQLLYNRLSVEFRTREVKEKAKEFKINPRDVDRYIREWFTTKKTSKIKNGHYKKIS
jgi:hypothetical protein